MLHRAGQSARRVAAVVISGVWRKQTLADVEARLAQLPAGEQRLVVGGVLGALFLLSLLAAQFGWIAMLAFWLVVILVIN
jgi:hypothetical protein